MTVTTGTVKDVLYLRRHLRMRCDSLRCVNRRVRSRRPLDLYEDEKADDQDQYPLDYFPKGLHVLSLVPPASSPDPDALPITAKPGTMMPQVYGAALAGNAGALSAESDTHLSQTSFQVNVPEVGMLAKPGQRLSALLLGRGRFDQFFDALPD